jgi:hypothetical protein
MTAKQVLSRLDRVGGKRAMGQMVRTPRSLLETLAERGHVEIRRGCKGGVYLTDAGAAELFRFEGAEPHVARTSDAMRARPHPSSRPAVKSVVAA